MQVKPPTNKRICVVDTETDPFEYGTHISPFTLGFYDGSAYFDFWGLDCVDQFFEHLATYDEELLIYAHNGGGFDFFFFLKYIDEQESPVIIRGRLVKMWFAGHEFRDSYKIIPAPLEAYQKQKFDYQKNKPERREAHKKEILEYQKSDCLYLYDLVSAYQRTFGDALTIGGTSIKVLTTFTKWKKLTPKQDEYIRPFYYGGRNQCFETGIIYGNFKVYDVNSMYPHVMRSFQHPIGNVFTESKTISDKTAFIVFEGENHGALPVRAEDGSLSFLQRQAVFQTSIHEFNAGLETGLIEPRKILRCIDCDRWADFKEFIDHFYDLRLLAKEHQDLIYDLFYKLLMNNSYGKFAQDPSTYKDYAFTYGEPPSGKMYSDRYPDGWRLSSSFSMGEWVAYVWEKPTKSRKHGYKNVATAASITGGSRAELLRGIAKATRPAYCDTDSIICESLDADLDNGRLGAWKLEAEAVAVAIAGKKLYTCLSDNEEYARKVLKLKSGEPTPIVNLNGAKLFPIKSASKGVRLTADEIIRVASGEYVEYANPVPHFRLNGDQDYITRRIRATGF